MAELPSVEANQRSTGACSSIHVHRGFPDEVVVAVVAAAQAIEAALEAGAVVVVAVVVATTVLVVGEASIGFAG